MFNNAKAAAIIIREDDCKSIKQFLDKESPNGAEKSTNYFWKFIYFYTTSSKYYCANYGNKSIEYDIRYGETNDKSYQRHACPCSLSN